MNPPDLWDDPTTAAVEYAPPVSSAMCCTMVLSVVFFVVVLARALARTCLDLSATDDTHTLVGSGGLRASVERWEHCLQRCAQSLNLAPMLCILFMAARMRALQ